MKKVKLLVVALAAISFTALYSCNGNASKKEATQEKTEEAAPEKTAVDTTAAVEETTDTTAVEEKTEATEQEAPEKKAE